ncbi:MAG: DUF349 domain-containing protein [Dysgonamonadaceae bacterium]|jgi:hypothetical protein|nr:DUF349 domain-containing protein [Dysgonamonadaceae bacterium]
MSDNIANEEGMPVISEDVAEAVPAVESDTELRDKLELAPETEPVSEVGLADESEPVAVDMAAVVGSGDDFGIVEVSESPVVSVQDREAMVLRLAEIVVLEVSNAVRSEVESLRQSFYRLLNIEIEEARKIFIEGGGLPEDFKPETDDKERRFKELLVVFREKKAQFIARNEKVLAENLNEKRAIIGRLKELTESNDTFDNFLKARDEYRSLIQRWKEIKHVSQSEMGELWKQYHHYSEKFYDLQKINFAMRDYDFRKNLELKEALCEAAERLGEEKDIVSAYSKMGKLSQEWSETGPVAPEFREGIRARFHAAASVINKRHNQHFEELREVELRKLSERIDCCEQLEAINGVRIDGVKEWTAKTDEVLAIQKRWKGLGFSRRRDSLKVSRRFNAACGRFFDNKRAFWVELRKEHAANLEKKRALCERVEAIQDSTDRDAKEQVFALREEWKSIKPVFYGQRDELWERFNGACNRFFSRRRAKNLSERAEEVENLRKKRDLIGRIREIDVELPAEELADRVRVLTSEWHEIGFVPLKEKDRLYDEYRSAVDGHLDRLRAGGSGRHLQSLLGRSSGDGGDSRLLADRSRLMHTYERLKGEIKTYENNLGFLSVSSKGGGELVRDMNAKVQGLRDELESIMKRIDLIDEQFS